MDANSESKIHHSRRYVVEQMGLTHLSKNNRNAILTLSLVTLIALSLLAAPVILQVAGIRIQNPGLDVHATPAVIQGQPVLYNGTGFTPNGTVDVSIDSGYPGTTYSVDNPTANQTGFIIGQFEAGSNIRPGTRQITFTDLSTTETAFATVLILELVQFSTNPITFPGAIPGNISSVACGGLVAGQVSLKCGPDFDAAAILPKPSAGWAFDHWEPFGNTTDVIPGTGVSCYPLTGTNSTNCAGYSEGALKAVFSAAITIVTDPTYVGSVSFGSCAGLRYTNGSVVLRSELLPEFTNLHVCANPSYGFTFTGWTSTGGINVANNLSPLTTLQLTGPGTLTAHYEVQITLQSGWNLISLPLVPSDSLIGDLLKPLVTKNEVVSVWTYTSTPRVWQYYLPGKTSTLTTMVDGNGYWIYMTAADKLNVTGTVIPNSHIPPTYPLVAGWNLLGFKPQPVITNDTVSQYLGGISGKYDPNNVWVYDSLSTNWIRTDPSYVLHPGQAIWILMNSPASFEP